jgi:hypothetical protein
MYLIRIASAEAIMNYLLFISSAKASRLLKLKPLAKAEWQFIQTAKQFIQANSNFIQAEK